ncbi:hypothetical protein CAXC1_90008 [Candidatus Xenohaliotis californiensis]|uniref:Uncharacterized protein n=1 Tax=Candidatus Xenohaliotis californiensis TaxID=84677 RepID=A0ABP0EXQ6_9RICK|nr:hypothetical protein CAXC1_90008 [Candidatus Xenohaliotis californiensis]
MNIAIIIFGPKIITDRETHKPNIPTIMPIIIISPSRFNTPKHIRTMPIAGIKLVSGTGNDIDNEHISESIANILLPNNDIIISSRAEVIFSTFLKGTEVFSAISARVVLLIDLFSTHLGSHGVDMPIDICNENSSNGIAAIVVEPGGTGNGIVRGREKTNNSIAKPRSLIAFFISLIDILSSANEAATSSNTSETILLFFCIIRICFF